MFRSLGLFFYFVSILAYLILVVNLFKHFYFEILSRYEYQLLILFTSPEVKIPELEALNPKYAFTNLINHYSLVNFLSANLILILIFVYMLRAKINSKIYTLSFVFLVFSIFPSYYFSRNLTDHFYINQLSSYALIFSITSHLFLGIYILKNLYRSDALAT